MVKQHELKVEIQQEIQTGQKISRRVNEEIQGGGTHETWKAENICIGKIKDASVKFLRINPKNSLKKFLWATYCKQLEAAVEVNGQSDFKKAKALVSALCQEALDVLQEISYNQHRETYIS